ncbi:MAE_28990/MAE_18760 family HEPN-like nuclease [Aeromonas sanarellii]|uniref:MAE_28990/MAE_18760 family HEPN-like nuclease n=1 Tax=Aeromonas sanarellii TaxID=633415 RepID=UPI0039875357
MSELRSNFVTLIVKGRIDSAHDSKKYSAFDEVTKYILFNQNSRARIPVKNVVDTQSNLSTTVLKEILWCLGFDYALFESKEKLIDQKLVSRRNHIAHGQEIEIGLDDFSEMADEVLGLMTTFRNMLENSTVTESYRAA